MNQIEDHPAHGALLNWSRWCRTGKHPGHCGSLEGRYRPPPTWHEASPPVFIDHALAIAVEGLVVTAPRQFSKHLIFYYIRRLPPQAMRKKLKLRYIESVDKHLIDAMNWLKRNLQIA